MTRPIVGICTAHERARWTVWDADANISPRAYSRAVAAAGGLPILLPPDPATAEHPDEVLDLLDALLLSGGGDLDPALYGAAADPRTAGVDRERDRFELALATRAIERELPVLGICRGMQLLNVSRGGNLVQHLDEIERHLHTPGVYSDHEVELEPESLAAGAIGATRVAVRSHHHQGIGELGEGLVASGRSAPDGLVEAIELPGHPFALGILWHAEEDSPSPVVESLARAARERRVAA